MHKLFMTGALIFGIYCDTLSSVDLSIGAVKFGYPLEVSSYSFPNTLQYARLDGPKAWCADMTYEPRNVTDGPWV